MGDTRGLSVTQKGAACPPVQLRLADSGALRTWTTSLEHPAQPWLHHARADARLAAAARRCSTRSEGGPWAGPPSSILLPCTSSERARALGIMTPVQTVRSPAEPCHALCAWPTEPWPAGAWPDDWLRRGFQGWSGAQAMWSGAHALRSRIPRLSDCHDQQLQMLRTDPCLLATGQFSRRWAGYSGHVAMPRALYLRFLDGR